MTINFYYGASNLNQMVAYLWTHYGNGASSMFVLCINDAMCEALDRALWELPIFLPHGVQYSPEANGAPICLGTTLPSSLPPILLNLSLTPLDHLAETTQLLELVSADSEALTAARQVAKRYKQNGCTVNFHDCAAIEGIDAYTLLTPHSLQA